MNLRSSLHGLLAKIVMIWLFLLCCTTAKADWIKAWFSPDAQVDSIERFMVIRDYKDSTFFGEILATPGDLNGDGINELLAARVKLTSYADDSGFLFFGGFPPDSSIDLRLSNFTVDFAPIGDVNADGFTDFGMSRLPIGGLQILFGGPAMDDIVDFLIPGQFTWITRAADFQGNGTLLIPSGNRNGGFVNLYRIDSLRDTIPEFTIPDTSRSFGNSMAVLDFNGDGFDDLAVSAWMNRDSNFVKFYFGGPSWDTIPDFELFSPNKRFGDLLVPVGDFNADGYQDIYIGGPSNHRYGIHFGGPNPSNEVGIMLDADRNTGSHSGPNQAVAVGDVNFDGFPDVLLGSSGAADRLFIFLGGPDADSVEDVYIENFDHIPGPQNLLGSHIAALGDFNGDGVDDFAAYSRTQTGCCWWAEVNLFAGWKGLATDVQIDHDPVLPNSIELDQNFPNPFNPETTIEFSLDRRSDVELVIYDILGRRVKRLIDQNLSAGSYTLSWDGTNQAGQSVASGVYYYQLKTDNTAQSKKMLLLK